MRASFLRRCLRGAVPVLFFLSATISAGPALAAPAPAATDESPWPYTVRLDAHDVLQVYPPQVDSWDGFELHARAAVVMREGADSGGGDAGSRATYGTIAIEAHTLVDKGTRSVRLDDFRIVRADFPSAGAQAPAWTAALRKDAEGRSRTIALDRLEAQVRQVQVAERAERMPLRNEAPRILFSRQPALLVSIDGAPHYAPVEGTALQRVLNTHVLLLRDAAGRHYLHVFDGWMSAATLDGDWAVLPAESADLRKVRTEAEKNRAADLLTGATAATSAQAPQPQKPPSLRRGPVPRIVVATQPSELIVSDGDWSWAPVAGTALLYVRNTTGNIFRDNADQQIYLLISGRWFRAPDASGPWTFVAANALPADFAKIPDDSEKENVKASVAGTPQAHEAAIAASVPQTAAVRISRTQLAPIRFDGAPQWAAIAGTPLRYAINTPTPLIEVDAHSYYAMENGVWFVADSASGPWTVATSVPAVIYGIPPSSPLHYVTYVRIFGTAGDVVYVGYSSGYQGSYVDPASGVVVYGTGYVYAPWIGTTWIGAPATYGYGAAVTYTPWTGWFFGFCFGWAWGAATSAWDWGWGPYPYWGPWGWGWGGWWGGVAYGPHGGAAAWGPGGWAGYTRPIYHRWGPVASVSRASGGFDAWTGNRWSARSGIAYNSRTGIAAAGQRGVVDNVYSGNFAAGSRGVVTGPGGRVVAGERGIAGNAITGGVTAGNRGAVYNPATGRVETYAGRRGADGGIERVGDDLYAGHDGNVYRNTGSGWEKHTDGGWQPVGGNAAAGGPARNEGAGLADARDRIQPDPQRLDADRRSRFEGAQRSWQLRQSKAGMRQSFGAGRVGGFAGGGFHGGGFRGRR